MTGLPDFEDEQFKSVKPKRPPVAQIINPRSHKGKMLPWGLAVTDKNAEDAGFTPPGGWETHDYLFKSAKEPEKAIILVIKRQRSAKISCRLFINHLC